MKYSKWAPVMVLAGLVAACEQGPVGPEVPPQFAHDVDGTTSPVAEQLILCKDGAAGTYGFNVQYTGTGAQFVSGDFDIAAGECVHLATSGVGLTATIVEDPLPANFSLQSISVQQTGNVVTAPSLTLATRTTVVVIGENPDGAGGVPPTGALVRYNNVFTPPPGDEGCTPGYWKQEQHFDSWEGHAPGDLVGSVFTGADASLADDTLLQALNYGGGPGVFGAQQILLRAGVAALLNASSSGVDYPLTEAQVIAAVDAALASGDRATILAAAADLDAKNNLGCTLN